MAKQGGRPAQGPISGKGSNFATRISTAMRLALEAEAESADRSKSQVAEMWLEEGRNLHGLGPSKAAVADAIRAIARLAALVAEQIGDPGESQAAREAFIAGGQQLLEHALPFTPRGNAKVELAVKLGGLTEALAVLDERVKGQITAAYRDPVGGGRIDADYRSPPDVRPPTAPDRDPVVAAYLAKVLPDTVGAAGPGPAVEAISLDRLIGYVRHGRDRLTAATIDNLADGLTAMKQAGHSFKAEIEACLQELRSCRKALRAHEQALADARLQGQHLAASITPPA